MLKKLILSIATMVCLTNIAACSPNPTWTEEVKLNDGRVIVVEQKRRLEQGIPREAWVTIKLPEFSASPIVWNEKLTPSILNIDGGKLYMVGEPPTGRETDLYGCPEHGYVGFIWDNEKWKRIPFGQIPEHVYDVNMLLDTVPPKGIEFLTLDRKAAPDLNGDGRYHALLRLLPTRGDGCR